MTFFIDTADVDEIRQAKAMGMADGVTSNPSLIANAGATCVSPFIGRLDDLSQQGMRQAFLDDWHKFRK